MNHRPLSRDGASGGLSESLSASNRNARGMVEGLELKSPEDETVSEKESLADKVFDKLRYSLMSGAYSPGARLNMRKIALDYGVSPTPAREAVMQLVREGALELKLGHQPRVPDLDVERYLEIREVRAPLERLAGELATVHVTAADLDALSQHHADFIAAEAACDWKEALLANRKFHFKLYHCSRNATLIRLIENLWLLIGPFISHQYPSVRRAHIDDHPHLMIIDALHRRSPSEAGDMVVRDLRDGAYLIVSQMKSRK